MTQGLRTKINTYDIWHMTPRKWGHCHTYLVFVNSWGLDLHILAWLTSLYKLLDVLWAVYSCKAEPFHNVTRWMLVRQNPEPIKTSIVAAKLPRHGWLYSLYSLSWSYVILYAYIYIWYMQMLPWSFIVDTYQHTCHNITIVTYDT